ncbi:hypothetical protein [Bosea vestrisii]|uniref:Uncharacterized protein n=1 Tax=Bosea vestrisii TaxID=151416 RepID=A0ABW0H787_9HYPH
MAAFQLTEMLSVLRGILEEHPQGMTIDAEMVAALVGGLRDMERCAEAQQQKIVALEDQLAECGLAPLYRPVPPVQANVIPWPIVPRPIPLQGGAA